MSWFDPVFLDDWYLEMCICQIRAISIDSRFALDVLKREGAERVYFLATHGVFSRGSFSTIASAGSPDRDISPFRVVRLQTDTFLLAQLIEWSCRIRTGNAADFPTMAKSTVFPETINHIRPPHRHPIVTMTIIFWIAHPRVIRKPNYSKKDIFVQS